MRRWILFFARIAGAIIALAVVVAGAAASAGAIEFEPAFQFALLVVGGVLVFADSIAEAWRTYRAPHLERFTARIRRSIVASLRAISAETGIDIAVIGGSAFVVSGRWWWKRLKRLERFRINDVPQPSPVRWTRDKGAIGRAWKDSNPVHVDMLDIITAWEATDKSEAAFQQLGVDRFGFNRSEFNAIVGKYSEILAIPIVSEDGSRVIGVYAVDIPYATGITSSGTFLRDQNVIRIATECATVLRDVVSPS